MRTSRLFSAASIVVTIVVLGVALVLGAFRHTAAAGQDRVVAVSAQASPTHGCGATWIRGITENKTGMPLRVASIGHKVTNKWCREPEDVRGHATNAWLVGDASGPTDLNMQAFKGCRDRGWVSFVKCDRDRGVVSCDPRDQSGTLCGWRGR